MLYKILKKDLMRKKVMNAILFVFMLTASALIAASSNLMYSTITAINYFLDKSEIVDFIAVTASDEEVTGAIEKWAEGSDMIQSYVVEHGIVLKEEEVINSEGKWIKGGQEMVLMTMPKGYNLVFDTEGKEFEVSESEVAVPVSLQKKLNLSIGDPLRIGIEGYQKEFKVSYIFKDALLGSDMMGMKRFIISDEDFEAYIEHSEDEMQIKFWGFIKDSAYDYDEVQRDYSSRMFPTYSIMTKSVLSTVYIMDLVLAAIMIIVSIFLILISFLILRFTIVFTVMEDYKQIGVMKAIGLRSSKIRGIYSLKYFALSIVSGAIGYAVSIPISQLMKENISQYILLNNSIVSIIIALLSVVAVVLITMLFCNYSTRRIRKISAIEAIRQGNTGERFKNAKKIKLHRHGRMRLPIYLALSDIVNDLKKYIILMITFILGTAIIIIPSNVITTLNSDESIELFGCSVSDFYVRDNLMGNQQDAREKLLELGNKFRNKDYDVKLQADLFTTGMVFNLDESEFTEILCLQSIEAEPGEFHYLGGTEPILENEIAITEKTAQYLEVGIGDRVLLKLNEETDEYIITGLFQSLNNLGHGVRLPEKYSTENKLMTSITIAGIFRDASIDKEKEIKALKKDFPEHNISTPAELSYSFIGDIANQIESVKNLILIIVIGINFLITSLLLRLLISKEIPEIAVLKSLGLKNSTIKLWQICRIGILLLVSIVLGTIIANTSGNLIAAGIFNIMGVTRLSLYIEPLQVYLIYPLILFTFTMLAVLLNLDQIRRTKVWELNNQE